MRRFRRSCCRAPSASRTCWSGCCPYWYDFVVPDLLSGQTTLIVAHGNSLRALVKHLDGVSDDRIAGLNIPTGIPLMYELDADLNPTTPGGRYLDPAAAADAIKAVASQGH